MMVGVVLTVQHAGLAETPAGWLKRQPKPVFREGHTLYPLTRYGWTLPIDARIELAENWGFCLEFGGYVTEKSVARLDDPESVESRLVALTASDPQRYPMFVICNRELPKTGFDGLWVRDADGKLLDAKAQSLDGTEWHKGMKTVYSPEAPDAAWTAAGQLRAGPLAKVRAKCPVAIVLNGGEYGIGVLGFAQKVWERDPRVVAGKGEMPWFEYVSRRKANAETLIRKEVRAAIPDAQLYIYYPTTGCTHRNRYGGWKRWAYDYRYMKPVSDLASTEHYYKHFNSGWLGNMDMLTMALNARGAEIAQGQPFCYDWLCAGWPRGKEPEKDLADLELYTGFLKCLYAAGMLGGNAGYYSYPKPGGFKAEFPEHDPPHWLRQMVAFSRVHALFSHLESHIRNGELVAGPDRNRFSKDQPAYELPTGSAEHRVVARKHREKREWLIAAWAPGGREAEVTVEVPGAGRATLLARPGGSVYTASLADDGIALEPQDPDPLRPTAHRRNEQRGP